MDNSIDTNVPINYELHGRTKRKLYFANKDTQKLESIYHENLHIRKLVSKSVYEISTLTDPGIRILVKPS